MKNVFFCFFLCVLLSTVVGELKTRKAVLTQWETRNSGACFERPVKEDLSQSPEGARRLAAKLSIVFYSYSPEGATVSFSQRRIG